MRLRREGSPARHRDLNTTSLGEWLDDVRRCDAQLQEHGSAYTRYFRFPMLHQGADIATRDAVAQALAELGSSTAHVSVDTSEWVLADGYVRAHQRADAAAKYARAAELIRHVGAALAHGGGVARRKPGRRVPRVLLLHANLLIADQLQELLEALSYEAWRSSPCVRRSPTPYMRCRTSMLVVRVCPGSIEPRRSTLATSPGTIEKQRRRRPW